MDERERDRIMRKKGLRRYTENTIISRKALMEELERIRSRGYSNSNAEHDELIRAVACPVRNHDGTVIVALGMLGLLARMTPDRIPAIAPIVKETADEVSRQLDYMPAG